MKRSEKLDRINILLEMNYLRFLKLTVALGVNENCAKEIVAKAIRSYYLSRPDISDYSLFEILIARFIIYEAKINKKNREERKFLSSLEDELKLPLVLRDVASFSYSDVSKILEIPYDEVQRNILLARRKIEEALINVS